MLSPRGQANLPSDMKYTREMLRQVSEQDTKMSPGARSKGDEAIMAVMAAIKSDPDYEPVPADNSQALMAVESEKEE